MTGREDDVGRMLRSLLLEETKATPVDAQHAAVRLRRQLADTRRRRRVTLAVAASIVAAVVVTAAAIGGRGWLGDNNAPAQKPDHPEAVARGFLDAVGRYDADTAISYLATGAIVQGDAIARGSDAAEQLRPTLAYYRAFAYQQTIKDCDQQGNLKSEVIVGCAFYLGAIRSDDIGLGPYTDNHWSLTVRDGKIVSAKQQIAYETNGFSKQAWEPFARWVSIYHPEDVLTMYVDDDKSTQQFTEDSNRLWEQRSIEYVTVVKQDPAAHLDEPKVAAYVAKLDSICAAAQTKAKDEIQAVPRQNQAAVTEARDKVMRETIPTLRAAPSPRSVYWPYEGRAFPLMEKLFNEYPHMAQPPEEWLPRQIQQTPGLDKCIFPV